MRTLEVVPPTPEQLTILQDTGLGFRLIRGAAGSGKTITALLRLQQLCRARQQRRGRLSSSEPIRVLVLTFNRTLQGYISQLVTEQVDQADDLILTVDTFAHWALGLIGGRHVLSDGGRDRIAPLVQRAGVPKQHLDYYTDEIEYVLGRFPPGHLDAYLQATRSGRGRAPVVSQELRKRFLDKVIDPYTELKSPLGQIDWNDVALQAAHVPSKGYDVVVVDETQDLPAN